MSSFLAQPLPTEAPFVNNPYNVLADSPCFLPTAFVAVPLQAPAAPQGQSPPPAQNQGQSPPPQQTQGQSPPPQQNQGQTGGPQQPQTQSPPPAQQNQGQTGGPQQPQAQSPPPAQQAQPAPAPANEAGQKATDGIKPEVQDAVSKAAQTAAENVIKQGGSKEEANAAAAKAAQAAVTAANNLQKQNPNASGNDLANSAQNAAKPVVEAFQKNKNADVSTVMPKPAPGTAAPAASKPEEVS